MVKFRDDSYSAHNSTASVSSNERVGIKNLMMLNDLAMPQQESGRIGETLAGLEPVQLYPLFPSPWGKKHSHFLVDPSYFQPMF